VPPGVATFVMVAPLVAALVRQKLTEELTNI
jgi:hypothetical protein